jgi:hypothetical protein
MSIKALAVALLVAVSASIADRPAGSESAPRVVETAPEHVVLHGQVLSVTGLAILLRTDDGRRIFVNLAQIPPAMVPFLTEGHRVAVLGNFSPTSFVAQAIERVW